jgi:adenosylhomocysteine nucleosidase
MHKVLLIVPLPEEFDEVLRIFPSKGYERVDDEFLYDLGTIGEIQVTGAVLGEAGPVPAAQRTERLISLCSPELIAVTGIAGGLSTDMDLADVVIAEEINHYLANSKVVAADSPHFRFELSGRVSRTSYPLLQVIRNFRHAAPDLYADWEQECAARVARLGITRRPRVGIGHIACGDSVGDSPEFIAFLKQRSDRKYVALEMESSGVAEAASARRDPVPLLILRGISDRSHDKGELEEASKGSWRVAAVANAVAYLQRLMRWGEFLALFAKDAQSQLHAQHIADVRKFLDRNK